jgi:hypothetical protein
MIIQLGNVSEAAGALATFLAVCVALYFSHEDTRNRAKKEKWSQAVRISAWPIRRGSEAKVVISNVSLETISNVVLSYGVAYGAGLPYLKGNANLIFIKRVPPGQSLSPEPMNPGGGMHTQTGIAISFRDARGNYWRRDATGKLEPTKSTFQELDVIEPIGEWANLTHYKPQ